MTYAVHTQYRVRDGEAIAQLIDENCFATLVSQHQGKPFANHFPIFYERSTDTPHLFGHMHRFNTQIEHLKSGQNVLAIFQGPHVYVPPHADCDANAFPTMSFMVVHVYGKAVLVEERDELFKIVQHTVEHFQRTETRKWNFDVPEAMVEKLLKQIVGFRIAIDSIETQFKLQQDRGLKRRRAIQSYLAESADERDRAIANWMERSFVWDAVDR